MSVAPVLRHIATPAFFLLVALGAGPALAAPALVPAPSCARQEALLDSDWRFHLGDIVGSEQTSANDASWRSISLPHDWAIEGPFAAANPSGGQGAFAPMGVGWYRKHLRTPPSGCSRRTLVQFDGIMANSDVWINGHLLGHRPNGYVTIRYDLTPFLTAKPGADNVLAVRADNQDQPSSRFYQGAGIYRHVHLLQVPPIHFDAWANFVSTPHVATDAASVVVATELRNDGAASATAKVQVVLLDPQGREVTRSSSASAVLTANAATAFHLSLQLPHPHLWNLDDPAMYTARVTVQNGKTSGDSESVKFGVRDAHFEAATGFWLNGRNIKVRGVALHSDIGALGMAAPLSLWEHRLRAMQRMGANAVRTAHNPVAPEFLDLCDRMGMLVLDEFFDVWTLPKNKYDYHLYFPEWNLIDARDTIRRDRNHPSVIAWSAGNEIRDTTQPEIAKPVLAALVAAYHREDPTRPVTQALFRPNVSHDYDNGLADLLDVVGQNYRPNEIIAAHEQKPSRKIIGTENGHDRATWLAVRDHAPYSGLFIWAGTDYLGESRRWPIFVDPGGLMDRTDFDKPDSLEHESWWSSRPVLHLVRRVAPVPKAPTDPGYEVQQYRPPPTTFADWTPANLTAHVEHVEVYSNCAEVSLRLNGQDLGAKPLAADLAPRTWDVPFASGTLEARCRDHAEVATTLQTAGPATALRLATETPALGTGFDDVAMVRLTVVDAHGVAVPGADVPVTFAVSGPAALLATDNADYTYSAPFSSPQRTTLGGHAVAFVRSSGRGVVRVSAHAPGLADGALQLTTAVH